MIRRYTHKWLAEGGTPKGVESKRDEIHVYFDDGKSVGLGDTVKKAIDTVTFGTIKPCGGCKRRRAKLNRLFPYT